MYSTHYFLLTTVPNFTAVSDLQSAPTGFKMSAVYSLHTCSQTFDFVIMYIIVHLSRLTNSSNTSATGGWNTSSGTATWLAQAVAYTLGKKTRSPSPNSVQVMEIWQAVPLNIKLLRPHRHAALTYLRFSFRALIDTLRKYLRGAGPSRLQAAEIRQVVSLHPMLHSPQRHAPLGRLRPLALMVTQTLRAGVRSTTLNMSETA